MQALMAVPETLVAIDMLMVYAYRGTVMCHGDEGRFERCS